MTALTPNVLAQGEAVPTVLEASVGPREAEFATHARFHLALPV